MITEVKEIPESLRDSRETRRACMKRDIEEIYQKGIRYAEVTGDYNYNTLRMYLREEAHNYISSLLRSDPKVQELTYSQKRIIRTNSFWVREAVENILKVRSKKCEDRVHVFVECRKELYPEELQKLIDKAIKEDEKIKIREIERGKR